MDQLSIEFDNTQHFLRPWITIDFLSIANQFLKIGILII